MTRISIEVSPDEHRKLKALAAIKGLTIKEYILKSTVRAKEPNEETLQAFKDVENGTDLTKHRDFQAFLTNMNKN